MQAIDTNVLVYGEITSSQHHRQARQLLTQLAEGAVPWALPWPCIYEFLRVVTHPRVLPAGTIGDRCSGSQGDYGFAFHSVVERDR